MPDRSVMSIQAYLTQIVHRAARPDQPCLVFGDRRIANARFAAQVARLAGAFGRLGVAPDERVAVIALNSERFVEAIFGSAWAGAAANPINVRWSPTEMAYALNDCRASVNCCGTRVHLVSSVGVCVCPASVTYDVSRMWRAERDPAGHGREHRTRLRCRWR
jgi:acyl-CoA synthetase (AMP-forming)/AMP-acid ligase II